MLTLCWDTGNCQNKGNTWVNEGYERRCFHTGVVPELIKQLKHSIMLRVMYKNSQLPVILAIMARRYLSYFEKGVSKENRGFTGCVCVSVTRSQPNWTLMGDSGAVPETVFSTTINKTPKYGISHGRMLSHPSKLLGSMPRRIEAVLAVCGAQHRVSFIFGSYLYKH